MVVLVANPTSGSGKGRRLIPPAVAGLRSLGIDHRVVVTEGPDHPERAAREAAEGGAEILVALGGDGLASACANGVLGTATALAVIPAGHGNDFARCLGLDVKRPLDALSLLRRGSNRRIDAIRAEGDGWGRHFVCVGGAGFDSETNEYANSLRRLGGTAKYVVSVFRTLARFRPAEFTLRLDGEERRLEAMMVAVGNASSYGGGMRVCPDALLDDGALDLCVVGALGKLEFAITFPRVFRGTHVRHPAVTVDRGEKLELEASRPFPVYADGEPLGRLPASFTVVPGALEVVAP